ncbi:hypothetical protein DL770_010517 [Monosporascus sp. CRB-9-2]|nr:hypothetical protein DL770_010517 [Monosporascus sp. CRB-9-2]
MRAMSAFVRSLSTRSEKPADARAHLQYSLAILRRLGNSHYLIPLGRRDSQDDPRTAYTGGSGTRKQALQTSPPLPMEDSLLPTDTFSALVRLRAFAEAELEGDMWSEYCDAAGLSYKAPLRYLHYRIWPQQHAGAATAVANGPSVNNPVSSACGLNAPNVLPISASSYDWCTLRGQPGLESKELMPGVGWANASPDQTAEVSFNINGTIVKFMGSGYEDRNRGSSSFDGNVAS